MDGAGAVGPEHLIVELGPIALVLLDWYSGYSSAAFTIHRSRLTLARMEAAAMEADRLSPFTKQRWGVRMAALRPWSRLRR